jgi:hypothetical protein
MAFSFGASNQSSRALPDPTATNAASSEMIFVTGR